MTVLPRLLMTPFQASRKHKASLGSGRTILELFFIRPRFLPNFGATKRRLSLYNLSEEEEHPQTVY
jgi:hypothetical protein